MPDAPVPHDPAGIERLQAEQRQYLQRAHREWGVSAALSSFLPGQPIPTEYLYALELLIKTCQQELTQLAQDAVAPFRDVRDD